MILPVLGRIVKQSFFWNSYPNEWAHSSWQAAGYTGNPTGGGPADFIRLGIHLPGKFDIVLPAFRRVGDGEYIRHQILAIVTLACRNLVFRQGAGGRRVADLPVGAAFAAAADQRPPSHQIRAVILEINAPDVVVVFIALGRSQLAERIGQPGWQVEIVDVAPDVVWGFVGIGQRVEHHRRTAPRHAGRQAGDCGPAGRYQEGQTDSEDHQAGGFGLAGLKRIHLLYIFGVIFCAVLDEEWSVTLTQGSGGLTQRLVILTQSSVGLTQGPMRLTQRVVILTRSSMGLTQGLVILTQGTVRLTQGLVILTQGTVRLTQGFVILTQSTVRLTQGLVILT